jgi:hypothetical protein
VTRLFQAKQEEVPRGAQRNNQLFHPSIPLAFRTDIIKHTFASPSPSPSRVVYKATLSACDMSSDRVVMSQSLGAPWRKNYPE